MAERKPAAHRKAPIGVKVIAAFIVVMGIALLVLGIAGIIGGGLLQQVFEAAIGAVGGVILVFTGILLVILAAVHLVLGWGLFELRNWARVILLVFTAIGALFKLLPLLAGEPTSLVGLIIDAAIIFYLTRPEIRQRFA